MVNRLDRKRNKADDAGVSIIFNHNVRDSDIPRCVLFRSLP
jgi:hypothetical protein